MLGSQEMDEYMEIAVSVVFWYLWASHIRLPKRVSEVLFVSRVHPETC